MVGKQSEMEAGIPDGFHDIRAEARREGGRDREREEGKKRGREVPFGSLIKGVWSYCLCKGPGVSMCLVGFGAVRLASWGGCRDQHL